MHYFWVILDGEGKGWFGEPFGGAQEGNPGKRACQWPRQPYGTGSGPDLKVPQQSECEKCQGQSTSSNTPSGQGRLLMLLVGPKERLLFDFRGLGQL